MRPGSLASTEAWEPPVDGNVCKALKRSNAVAEAQRVFIFHLPLQPIHLPAQLVHLLRIDFEVLRSGKLFVELLHLPLELVQLLLVDWEVLQIDAVCQLFSLACSWPQPAGEIL